MKRYNQINKIRNETIGVSTGSKELQRGCFRNLYFKKLENLGEIDNSYRHIIYKI